MVLNTIRTGLLLFAAAAPWRTEVESATHKLAYLQSGTMPRGSVVYFSAKELNAYALDRIPAYAPEGVRNARLELGSGTATASAQVDFLKLRHAKGVETNWLIARLIEGERPLSVTAHIQSFRGMVTVTLDQVQLSGIALSGEPLNLLIQTFFTPIFPGAKIGEPFPLQRGLDHVRVTPAGLWVYARK